MNNMNINTNDHNDFINQTYTQLANKTARELAKELTLDLSSGNCPTCRTSNPDLTIMVILLAAALLFSCAYLTMRLDQKDEQIKRLYRVNSNLAQDLAGRPLRGKTNDYTQ